MHVWVPDATHACYFELLLQGRICYFDLIPDGFLHKSDGVV